MLYYLRMIFEEIMLNIVFEVLYALIIWGYLSKLKTFNHLVGENTSAIDVMFMNDGEAWYLLAFALVLSLIGGFLIWFHFKRFRDVGGYSMLTLIFFMAAISWLLFLVFKEINNPILKSAIVLIFGSAVVFSAASSS